MIVQNEDSTFTILQKESMICSSTVTSFIRYNITFAGLLGRYALHPGSRAIWSTDR